MKLSSPILNKALAGERIDVDEAVELFENADLLELGYVANEIRKRLHPDDKPATYVIQRNVNYSNVCTASCTFCAFYTFPDKEIPGNPAYVLDYEVMKQKIQELRDIGGTEVLLQGGHNPSLGLDYYLELFKRLKSDFPNITLHALSPAEINHIAEKHFTDPNIYGDGTNLSQIPEPSLGQIKFVLESLRDAGMDSLPGAGAEILTERVRKKIAPLKIKSQRWLDIMEVAHRLGMRGSATMMYGHVESYKDRAEHLEEIRNLQDKTDGFTAFVTWSFQAGDTPLAKLMDKLDEANELPEYNKHSSGDDYLRTLAISRIFLDNVKNFQSSWVTQGTEVGQMSLSFGCNDLGGNMMEENVVSAANTTHSASVKQMQYLIERSGKNYQQRDTQYNYVGA